MTATVIVPTHNRAGLLDRCLSSLVHGGVPEQLIVVDNGSTDETPEVLRRFPDVDVLRLPRNEGFSRAVNRAARVARGDALVLVNNDCVCDPAFVERLAGGLDPTRNVVMAAGVLRDARYPNLIDTAGMELDATLLPFDYLNGHPVSALAENVADPIGPSGAAAAFHRDAFLDAGGFDEALFAYWEDVDLVLRLRLRGALCALVPDAQGVHEHSATLGSGSPRKNYLVGYGRGYVSRKWSAATWRRLPQILARDVPICLSQAVVDRNLAGARGRLGGYRAAASLNWQDYPTDALVCHLAPGALTTLRRRARRRARLREQGRTAA